MTCPLCSHSDRLCWLFGILISVCLIALAFIRSADSDEDRVAELEQRIVDLEEAAKRITPTVYNQYFYGLTGAPVIQQFPYGFDMAVEEGKKR